MTVHLIYKYKFVDGKIAFLLIWQIIDTIKCLSIITVITFLLVRLLFFIMEISSFIIPFIECVLPFQVIVWHCKENYYSPINFMLRTLLMFMNYRNTLSLKIKTLYLNLYHVCVSLIIRKATIYTYLNWKYNKTIHYINH